ncbi:Cof-type HAD-IIB family hydrolase [Spiroplasma sp. AdecLV25b]|uniref:Cof-type HAD-IIB family hydrolase n=1 Tax=Spiroplasma sp. AdecLV25b TaxID=3027162 RepID=UPI0027E0D53D|nr:Cof-type HAD-IIB family hydrolase [Spiroplasma sp. AdecLV25b]
MVKIIFTDVDGTLFDSTSALSEVNLNACLKAQKNNIKVVINTGRYGENAIRVGEMINAEKYNGYIIGNDGAEIWSFEKQEWIYLQQLTQTDTTKLYKFLTNYNDKMILHFNSIDTLYVNHAANSWGKWVENLQIKIVQLKDFKDITMPISKIMVILEKYLSSENFAKFISAFKSEFPHLTIVQYHTNVFSIGVKDISKGSAVQWLCNLLEIDTKDALTIGDGFNDLPMFEISGHPIVMENANIALKPFGKIIAPSNDDHGVGHIINNYVLKGIKKS